VTDKAANIAQGRYWYRTRKARRYWTQRWVPDPNHPYGGYWDKRYRGPNPNPPEAR
jgi:hypothetical protein